MNKPTELTSKDLDNFVALLKSHEEEKPVCFKCGKEFHQNYSSYECDECFFSKFPKKDVEEFCKSFFE